MTTSPKSKAVIPYVFRRITFNFAYPDYSNGEISMRCVLKGRHEAVTETISKPLITYYLEAGQYDLTVTALDENNQILGTTDYYFSVRPPLYLSESLPGIFSDCLFCRIFRVEKHQKTCAEAKRSHPA